jgi:hypothetical protein
MKRPIRVTAEELTRELSRLVDESRDGLAQRWRDLYGAAPPPRTSRSLLMRAVAYKMQEQVYGGLPASIRRRLVGEAGPSSPRRPPRQASPGTVLLREWWGKTHRVTIEDGGVLYQGRRYRSLSNPIYIGEIAHKGVRHAGLQEPILERPLWAAVQHQLREQGVRRSHPHEVARSPLRGKIFDQAGNRLTPSHAVKDGRRYRYYVSRRLVTGTSQEDPDGWRLPAPQIERLVADEAIQGLADRAAVAAALEKAKVPTGQFPSALAAAERWCRRLRSDTDRDDALVRLVDRVELGRGSFGVSVNLGPLLEGGQRQIALVRETALAIKRRGVEMRLVLESGAPKVAKVGRVLLKEISRAHRCFGALLAGRAASVEGVAAIEGVDARYLSNLLPLAFLSPDIVAAIVHGTQPADLTAKKLIRRIDLPLDWPAQKQVLGFRYQHD